MSDGLVEEWREEASRMDSFAESAPENSKKEIWASATANALRQCADRLKQTRTGPETVEGLYEGPELKKGDEDDG